MILIVEGFWGSGKSAMCCYLAERLNCLEIPEPNHREHGITEEISAWYFREYRLLLERARLLESAERRVVMERSALSTVAFLYAQNKDVSKLLPLVLDDLAALSAFLVVYLRIPPGRRINTITIEDESVRLALDLPSFRYRYDSFYLDILAKFLGKKLHTFTAKSDRIFDDIVDLLIGEGLIPQKSDRSPQC